ncbi:hypothetical protein NDU88_006883 [Pleurodeles waltl]|uniref:Secreted protein n=1 Tax=Pleurodeles waltl TaxID=8319 RepID=A0AAV7NRG8_PLEWA|nr:hypothetical protein NDU88_006883 [Pleurodeles waltl]
MLLHVACSGCCSGAGALETIHTYGTEHRALGDLPALILLDVGHNLKVGDREDKSGHNREQNLPGGLSGDRERRQQPDKRGLSILLRIWDPGNNTLRLLGGSPGWTARSSSGLTLCGICWYTGNP